MRYSRQRQQVYQYVCSSSEHPTAQMTYEALRNEMPKLSLGTVYRNLNQLADAGLLRKIPLPDGGCRFDGTLREHSHVVCERCGRVDDVAVDPQDMRAKVESETGYALTALELMMRGVCRSCTDGEP